MTVINKWKIYCETESAWVYWYLPEDDSAPTTCSNNTSHTVTAGTASIDEITGTPLKINDEGEQTVAAIPQKGTEKYLFSWNYCDESSWVENSVKVDDFEMRDTGDQTTWDTGATPSHINWIDIQHGRVIFEDELFFDYNIFTGMKTTIKSEYANLNYEPIVKLLPNGEQDLPENWVTKTEDTDFYVDYNSGEIIFYSAQTSGDRVKAWFRKSCGTYLYTVAPTNGKRLIIEYAEAHGTSDFTMEGWIKRTIWVPYDEETMIVVPGTKKTYKTFIDLVMDSTGAFPVIPACGGDEKIGEFIKMGLGTLDILQLPFRFLAVEPLNYSDGVEYRITLEKKWTGTFANVVLYAVEEDEPT
jgi:hypothetical protein